MCIVGLGAVLIEILLHSPINYILRKIPLGRIPFVSQDAAPKLPPLYTAIPALIIGIYIGVFRVALEFEELHEIFAGIVNVCREGGLIVVAVLVGIVLAALLAVIIAQSGLWGLMVRGSLVVIGNFGLSVLFGIIFTYVIGYACLALIFLFMLMIAVLIMRAVAIVSLFS